MKLRVARHVTNIAAVVDFYTIFLDLQVLGSFKDHDGYDGIFLGPPGENWHLEFTVSGDAPTHTPDDDDLLVFYFDKEKCAAVTARLLEAGYAIEKAKNPYWDNNGATFTDPEGYR